VPHREERTLVEYRDENELPDAAIVAMWEEAEPVELAAGPLAVAIRFTPSPWLQPAPRTTVTGRIDRWLVNLSSFGAASTRYPATLADAGDHLTTARSA